MGQKLTFPLAIKSRRSKLVHNVPPPKLARKCASEVRSSITALQRHLSLTESFVCSRLIGRTHMAEYRVYIMGPDGHFQNSVALDCADDDAAIEQAKQLSTADAYTISPLPAEAQQSNLPRLPPQWPRHNSGRHLLAPCARRLPGGGARDLETN